MDERRGTGKGPDFVELFKTVVENRRSRHRGVEAVACIRGSIGLIVAQSGKLSEDD